MITSVRNLAKMIRDMTTFSGEIRWYHSQPDVQMVRIFSVDRMKALGLSCVTPIAAGLERTVA